MRRKSFTTLEAALSVTLLVVMLLGLTPALGAPRDSLGCIPRFIEVTPPHGTTGVPTGHGINMVFGPLNPACSTMCWDTMSFHGWLFIMQNGIGDTLVLGPDDVEFWFGDAPNIGIEYHHPGGWPIGAVVQGSWTIADCDSHRTGGRVYFHVEGNSPPDPAVCNISFYRTLPPMGTWGVPASHNISMFFGPADSACTTFCIDTSSFEGVIRIGFNNSSDPGSPGGWADTIYLGPGDVEFDYSEWPTMVRINYNAPPMGWPLGAMISAKFHISDCDGHRAHGLTTFHTERDSLLACRPRFIEVAPPFGEWNVPMTHGINMVFGPLNPACSTMCWDTMSFHGWLFIMQNGIGDTLVLGPDDVEFWFGDAPNIGIEYHHTIEWVPGATITGSWTIADCDSHRADGRIYFHVEGDTTAPIDTFPPCFNNWHPADGTTMLSGPRSIGVAICDVCNSFAGHSGVNPDSIQMTVCMNSDTLFIPFDSLILSPIYCAGYHVQLNVPYPLPGGDYTVCVRAVDFAGNSATECVTWTIASDSLPPSNCRPRFIEVTPPQAAWDIPTGHGINMVFGPFSPRCTTMCWDTMSFHGWLCVINSSGAIDTIELGPEDVEFWFGDAPNIGIEYHYPGGWPIGSKVHGIWTIADCDGDSAAGGMYFHVEGSTPGSNCDIRFYRALPPTGASGVNTNHNIFMFFGPIDTACTTFCIDTSSFEGVVTIAHGGLSQTFSLGPGDVGFDYSNWPIVKITYTAPPMGWPFGAMVSANFHISDCDGNRAHGETRFHTTTDTPTDSFDVRWIVPSEFVWSACKMQEIAFLVEPHLPDDSLGFKINGVQYSLSSPEVSVFGDTVLFEPSEPFGEGIVRVRVLGKTLEFKIDSTPPMMYPMFPADRAMVRGGESFEVVYNIHERAMESGVDSSSISIAVFINGIPHGAYDIDDASVMYRGRALYFYPATAGITFMPGDSVMLLIAASDRTSLYYCGPNSRVEDLRFYIIDPNDTRSIRGTVVDGSTDDPLPGMKIKLYHYLGAYRPIPDITATTDASGSFIITDVPPGIYTLGAFDESDTYQPVFYLDRADYLEADPIPVDHTCPDTIVLATLHMIETPSGGRTCSIAGNVSEEGGDPVSAAYVVAISSEDDEIKGTGMTNPSGDYNLNVLSGDYYVLAFHGSYIPTFYGGSIDWTTAELVAAMNDVDSIDIELKAMSSGGGRSRIQGYVYADSGDDKSSSSVPLRGVRLYVIDSESGEPIAYDVSENNGSFCLDELQPGTYMLKADKPGYMSPTSYCEFTVNEDTSFVNIEMFSTTPVSENSGKQLPAELSISVSPNPFNSAVTLELEGVGATVRSPEQIAVEIFDINGRLVGNLSPSSAETAGFSEDPTPVVWQPDESITSGVYLIRARVGNAEATKKVVYLK